MSVLDIARQRLPEILTAVNSIGVGVTAWLTHQATKKADDILLAEDEELTFKERVKKTWKCYIPPAFAGVVTIATGIGSNRISSQRLETAAVIGAMYFDRATALEKRLEEKLGPVDPNRIDEKEKYKRLNDITTGCAKNEKMLCYESASKQWFHATQQELLMSEITLNKLFKDRKKVSLNQWLVLLPECRTKPGWGDRWGWTENVTEGGSDLNWAYYSGAPWIDVEVQLAEKDGHSYLYITYGLEPMEFGDNQVVMNWSGIRR
jgi:hypothetical protein